MALKADVDRLKDCIRTKNWFALKTGGRTDDRRILINMCKDYFIKEANFANPKTGIVRKQSFVDYNYSIEEVIEIISKHRKEILSTW